MSETEAPSTGVAVTPANRAAIVGFALALVGFLTAWAFWLIIPALLGGVGAVLGRRGRKNAMQGAKHGRLADWAVVLGTLAVFILVLFWILFAIFD